MAVASVADPRAQADRVKELYEQLAQARKEAGEKPVPFERFAAARAGAGGEAGQTAGGKWRSGWR